MKFKFLNVDLEMITARRPGAVTRCFREQGMVMYSAATAEDRYLSSFEVFATSRDTPASVLAAFKRIFKTLPPRAREEWAAATKRVFDFGYESTPSKKVAPITIPAPFVKFAATVDAAIVITVYEFSRSASQQPA